MSEGFEIKRDPRLRGDDTGNGSRNDISLMPRYDMEAGGNPAMAYGNSCVGRYRNGRGNARNNLEFHAGIHKLQGFFAAATKHEGVAALEAGNSRTRHFAGELHQQLIDFGLLYLVVLRHLAYIHHLCLRIAHPEYSKGHQTVVNHHIRLFENLLAAQGQESRIARTSPNQINLSRHLV